MSAEAIAIVGVGVALLAVSELVPLLLILAAGIRREIDHVRGDVHALTARVDSLAERVARIEGAMGALAGPWRPANGAPVPPAAPSTEATT